MIVVHGSQLYGKVDQVPGLFYVATKFFYLQFIPLIPLKSYVVPEDAKAKGMDGVPIRLSGKSILFTWLRTALILGGGVLAVIAIIEAIEAFDQRGTWINGAVYGLWSAILFYLLRLSYRFSYARLTRAQELALAAGIPLEALAPFFAGHDPDVSADELLPTES
jgi:hypothetical protein